MLPRSFLPSLLAALSFLVQAASAGTWSTTPWTGDASTGFGPSRTLWAYHFGSPDTATVNKVSVSGLNTISPAASGRFSMTGNGAILNNDTNELVSLGGNGSATMGRDFLYGGSPVTITLEGLSAGSRYVFSIFTCGWDTGETRISDLSSEGDTTSFDVSGLGNDKGRRLDYDFTATAAIRTITVLPQTVRTFHFYAVALQRPLVTVTSTADDGPGSLRQAVLDAPAGGLIDFAPALANQTVTLTASRILLEKSVTIDGGSAPGLKISGNNHSRIFRVGTINQHILVGLLNMTFRDGMVPATEGGGGAIIVENASLAVANCTFAGNTADRGGAIHAGVGGSPDAACILANCTFTGNTARIAGGAVSNAERTTQLIHCTISGNTAPVGGGILSKEDGMVELRASIVHGNANGDLELVTDSVISFQSSGGNILGTGEGLSVFQTEGSTNLINSDPLLMPLRNYGGPVQTMLPQGGSPAINRLSAVTFDIDARGYAREFQVDSGAIERGPVMTVANPDDAGAGSLRDTLAAVTVPDTRIQFAPALSGQAITLASALTLPAGGNMEFDASTLPGGIILRANHGLRTLDLGGGRILGLTRVTLAPNAGSGAEGINSGGTLYAADSTFRDFDSNSNAGTVLITGGTADFLRCTISGNKTSGDTAGFWLTGTSSQASCVNCTFSGNTGTTSSATGGITLISGEMDLVNTTVAGNTGNGNGGGIYAGNAAALRIRNCVIAGNADTSDEPDIYRLPATFAITGLNLIGNNTGVATFFPAGPLAGTAAAPLDPKLLPLANYGGLTATRPPTPDSPAIDKVSGSLPTKDQRGAPRPAGSLADLGAVEDQPAVVTHNGSSGAGSLRDAVLVPFATTVTFDPAFFNAPASFRHIVIFSPITLDRRLIIDASNIPDRVTVDGTSSTRLFEVQAGARVVFRRFDLRNAKNVANNSGNLTMEDCFFTRNGRKGNDVDNGGCISNSGFLTIRRCEFVNNGANVRGGCIYSQGLSSFLVVENSLFHDNRSGVGGGAIFLQGAEGIFVNTTIANNIAAVAGAGIQVQDPLGKAQLTHCTVSGNLPESSGQAGGITWDAPNSMVILENSVVAGNGSVNLAHAPSLTFGNNLITGNPKLGPIGNYGGPLATMMPLPGSPVVEGAVPLDTSPGLDMRGAPRPNGPLPDLGAVEAVPISTLGLTSTDGDTIPDVLEIPTGPYPYLSAFTNDSLLDTDNDGMRDQDEISDSTNPLDPNSKLRVTSFSTRHWDGLFTADIAFTSFPGLNYAAEWSTDLDFSDAQTYPLGLATGFISEHNLFPPGPRHFFRVKRVP